MFQRLWREKGKREYGNIQQCRGKAERPSGILDVFLIGSGLKVNSDSDFGGD